MGQHPGWGCTTVLTSTSLYRASVNTPTRRETQIRVLHGTTTVALLNTEALIAGSVTASLSSRVSRTADFTLPGQYFPDLPTDLLSPYRAIVEISTGIGYPDGSREIFPVFKGRIYDATIGPDGIASFRADDLAADVVSYRFEMPNVSQSGPGTSTLLEIRRLIQQAYPDATFGVNDSDDANVPILAWDDDRGQAIDDLASSLQSRWYTLGNGDFVVRRFPYVASTPIIALTDGPGNAISEASKTVTRDGTFNSSTVVSERLDGSAPVTATVRDNNPTSDTYFGGDFGLVSQVTRLQTPLDQVLANELARKQLVASLALGEQWNWTMVSDATLEPGDTVSISYRGRTATQVLDSIQYPLVADTMRVQSRSSIPEPILTGIEATEFAT
jgi:hypothetical protein